jgi:hypothetical protein
MSSLRPAKIVATVLHLIGGSLAETTEHYGPSCSCEGCVEAWRRNQSPERTSPRDRITPSRTRVELG